MAVSKFQGGRAGAVYACRVCKGGTRETGAGESSCGLCVDCFELAGLENLQSDAGVAEVMGSKAEIVARIASVEKRGKGDAGWKAVFAEVLAPPADEPESIYAADPPGFQDFAPQYR